MNALGLSEGQLAERKRDGRALTSGGQVTGQ